MRKIALVAGKFQPFTPIHFVAYKKAAEVFGDDNVFILTNDTVAGDESAPYSFIDKQQIITGLFDIKGSCVVKSTSPFSPKEFLTTFKTPVVAIFVAWDEKVAESLKQFYKNIESCENEPQPADVYYQLLSCDIKAEHAPEVIRKELAKNTSEDDKVKYLKTIYTKDVSPVYKILTHPYAAKSRQNVFVVRHGQRIDHVDKDWKADDGRQFDPPLSIDGDHQAEKLSRRLKFENIQHIISSPAIRCVATASKTAELLGLPILIEPGIGEFINPRQFEKAPLFLAPAELKVLFPLVDIEYKPVWTKCSIESFDELHQRCVQVANQLSTNLVGNSVWFTHLGPIGSLVAGLTKDMNASIVGEECSLTKVSKIEHKWVLVKNGEDHFLYNDDERDLSDPRVKAWRYAVFVRDNFTCQLCQKKGGSCQGHHISRWADSPALRFVVSNGICLCKECHQNVVTGREKDYEDYFTQLVKQKIDIARTLSKNSFSSGGTSVTRIVGEKKPSFVDEYYIPINPKSRA